MLPNGFIFFIYRKTKYKQMTVNLQFSENYPKNGILLELKSKTLSEKLLNKLVDICDTEMKKHIGKQQVIITLWVYFLNVIKGITK